MCPTRHCGNRSQWKLLADDRTTQWGDWQRVRLQENENEVPAGSMPRSIDIIVRDEQTERCKPGDKVLITGSLIVVPNVLTMMSPSELKVQVIILILPTTTTTTTTTTTLIVIRTNLVIVTIMSHRRAEAAGPA